MGTKSRQVALGGIFSALCVSLMFVGGLIPVIGAYTLAMLAGVMLLPVLVEFGCKPALCAYASAALLCLLLAPNREAAIMFVAFFGYYPIAKHVLERMRSRVREYACKLLLFNVSAVAGILVTIHLLGMAQALEGMDRFGRFAPIVLLVAGNVLFVLYDIMLAQVYEAYMRRLRPKIMRG